MLAFAELKSKDLKQVITNVLPENSRKPKMKGKATKVFKYLMNFLQMKPKRKFEDLERLCIPSTQESFTYENPETCRVTSPKPTACHKTDGVLSMSWSYLVHDPFTGDPNLEEPNDTEFEVSYDESYFEDDYCQDYRENDGAAFRSPACDIQNLSYGRLFEPDRTPCGEFRRSVVSRVTPCRRYASVPNFSVDNPILSAALADASEIEPVDESQLLDIDDFMLNHPPVGLNIAFDNVLDETSSENRGYSVNRVPLSSTEVTERFECDGEGFLDETYICEQESRVSDSSASVRSTSADKTPQGYIARDSIHMLQIKGQSTELTEGPREMLVSEVQSGLERYTLNTFLPSSSCERFPPLTHISKHQDITSLTKRTSKQYGSVESGYNSSGSPSSSGSPEIMSLAAVQGTHSSHPYTSAAVVSLSNAHNNLTDVSDSKFQQVHSKAAHRVEIIETNAFQTSTSSPMRVINTPAFLNTKILPSMIISPINQIMETPKMPNTARDSQGCLKRSWHQRRNESTAKDSNVDSKCLQSNAKTSVTVVDSFCDNLIATAAAEFILSRIQFKEELQSYIKVEELVAYLKSHYMSEIELSNTNVKSISEYRQITQDSCDMFTPDRLTPTNSYSELLTAVLTGRPRIVSACEQFIFENRDYFIGSKHFHEAPPEIILMLLCNNPSTIFGTVDVAMTPGDLVLELNTHLEKYIEKHRTENPRIYFRVKNIFTCIQKKRTNLTRVNSAALKLHSKDLLDQDPFYQSNHVEDSSHLTPLSSVHSKAISNAQNNTLQMCKGTRMFRNKQLQFTTQGNVPETTQKLLDYVGARKTPRTHRSSHQSKLSFATGQNPSEFVQMYTTNVSKYKVFSNSPFPSEQPKKTRITNSKPAYAAKTYDSQKWKPRSTVKYVTVV